MKSHRVQESTLQPPNNFELLMIYQSPPRSCSAQATAQVGLTCGLVWHSRKECCSPRKSYYTKVWWISALGKLICRLTYNLLEFVLGFFPREKAHAVFHFLKTSGSKVRAINCTKQSAETATVHESIEVRLRCVEGLWAHAHKCMMMWVHVCVVLTCPRVYSCLPLPQRLLG